MSLLYECINTVIAVLISMSVGNEHMSAIQVTCRIVIRCLQSLVFSCACKSLACLSRTPIRILSIWACSLWDAFCRHIPKLCRHTKMWCCRVWTIKTKVSGVREFLFEINLLLFCRLRALDLLYGMVGKKNIMEIVKRLMEHVDNAEGANYRDELLSRIINICSHNNYQYITDFEWSVRLSAFLLNAHSLSGTFPYLWS